MKLLMCKPDYYDLEYEINPWMDMARQVKTEDAMNQWRDLYNTLIKCGATIELIPQVSGLPDMVFTANAGLLLDDKIILSYFKFKERQRETNHYKEWFQQQSFDVMELPEIENRYFEGEGDALIAGDKLFVAYGFRSSKDFYAEKILNYSAKSIIECELVDPYFYHLDTCFCPLDDQTALWYPEAFSLASRKMMAKEIELIPVEEAEAKRFACNAVVLGKNIVLPSGCPAISSWLEDQGYKTHACVVDEYIKAGGACKCLVMKLD